MDIEFKLVKTLSNNDVSIDWDNIAKPYPANKYIPDSYKQQPSIIHDTDQDIRTIKLCQPFIDGMTNGYVIPFPEDLTIKVLGKYDAEGEDKGKAWFSKHGPLQYGKMWFKDRLVIKITSPWIIKTPPGYSCYFSHPNGYNIKPFYAIPSVIDTDSYEINPAFPMIYMDIKVGCDIHIKKGTPMIQVHPFKRENWQATFSEEDTGEYLQRQQEFWRDPNGFYLKNAKQPKKYT